MQSTFERQIDIFNPLDIRHSLTIVGLGGIGSFAAYMARKMGFMEIRLCDHDVVEPHNVPSQHYDAGDVGKLKVSGIQRQLSVCLDDNGRIATDCKAFTRDIRPEGIVLSCVDSMRARQEIWESVKNARAFVPFFVDGRVGIEWDDESGKVAGEWIEVFSIRPPLLEDRELYEKHLFSDEEAAPLRCTAQAVVYVGFLVAGFIGANIRKWYAGEPYHRRIVYDCLTNQVLIASV